VVCSEENTGARGVPHVAKHHRTLTELSETTRIAGIEKRPTYLKDKYVDAIAELILYSNGIVPGVAARANNVTSLS
jgi:hypothetical protein